MEYKFAVFVIALALALIHLNVIECIRHQKPFSFSNAALVGGYSAVAYVANNTLGGIDLGWPFIVVAVAMTYVSKLYTKLLDYLAMSGHDFLLNLARIEEYMFYIFAYNWTILVTITKVS